MDAKKGDWISFYIERRLIIDEVVFVKPASFQRKDYYTMHNGNVNSDYVFEVRSKGE